VATSWSGDEAAQADLDRGTPSKLQVGFVIREKARYAGFFKRRNLAQIIKN